MNALPVLLVLLLAAGALAYHRVSLRTASTTLLALLALLTLWFGLGWGLALLWLVLLAILVPLNVEPWRIELTRPVFAFLKRALPRISQTEQEALEAGDVWWDAELFSGKPDWSRLLDLPAPRLSEREQAFLDGPVETLCRMLDDWDITHHRKDLPLEVWDFIRRERFFGMIIPEEHGGLGFSALAHSEVVMKIASRSITAAVTVMVPNSLGPAKLLLQYGTPKQKEYYLPRLARGEEIPCFALTAPEAGSDAAAIPDTGVVCRGQWQGEEVLGIRLNWEKRYITLGPVATLLGLAFKLYDPEHLLGEQEELGITLALIPTDLPGIDIDIGNRHWPLDIPFQNGPNRGRDVFIPLDQLIGGPEQAGHGWRMLMECLSEGRGISLPALSTSAAKVTSRYTGAYARIRRQFGLPIGRFEGIEEPLARIGGNAWLMDAARRLTATALDQGERPSVVSAILKQQLTERMRIIVNDAMDIHGGSGICMGPHNYLARTYEAIPISITVEGANILTRSLIIFGQGAIRCHPWLLREIRAAQNPDPALGLLEFDEAFWKHIGHVLSNLSRAFWLGLTNGHLARVPGDRHSRPYFRRLERLSAGFALLADAAMLTLGGSLKRRERISGRFADVLSNLYLCSAALKQYHDQNAPEEALPLVHWACQATIHRAQQSMLAVLWNLPVRPMAWLLRFIVFPWGKVYAPPGDRVIHQAADFLLHESTARDRLTAGIFITNDPDDRTGRIEHAFRLVLRDEDLERRLHEARRKQGFRPHWDEDEIEAACTAGLLDADEAARLRESRAAVRGAIMVDEFKPEDL